MGWRPRVITTSYWTRAGVRRRIRLYECWLNMNGRLRGGKTTREGKKYWVGHESEFLNWPHFRTWALENGFGKGMELDRIDSSKGYSPDNCQWLLKPEHSRKSSKSHKPRCMCPACGWRRRTIAERFVSEEAPF